MGKTPEYTKNAIRNYQAGKDRVNLLLDYGTKDRIKKRYGEDVSITAYIKRLIENDLDGSVAVISEWEVKRVPGQVQEQTETRRRQPEGLPSFML